MSDNELDNLFKEAADGFKPPNDPSAWQDMTRKLDKAVVTTSFWNWKTISSTALVGVVVLSLMLYVGFLNSDSLSTNQETITSLDASNAKKTEKDIEGNKYPNIASDIKQEVSSTTQALKKESESNIDTQSARNKKNSLAGAVQSAEANSEKNNSVQGSDIRKPQALATQPTSVNFEEKNKSAQSEKLAETQTQVSERNSQASLASEMADSDKLPASSAGKDKNNNNKSIAAAAGVAIAGNAMSPASSGNVASGESRSNNSASNGNTESTFAASNTNDSKTQSVPADEKSETIAKVAVVEKSLEPSGTANNVSENNSKQTALNAEGSKNQTTSGVDEVKKGISGDVESITKLTVAEKTLEPSNPGNVVLVENNSNQTVANAQSSKTQSAIAATDSVKKKDQVKEETLTAEVSEKAKPDAKKENITFNRFAIKLAVAPDYSTVKNATPNSLGINYGGLIEFKITKHWSIATGGIWSKKIYTANDVEYSGYHADWVDGDCRMWDIPINVYYNFTSQKPFSFYASAGLSSYLMNEENYVYYVETSYGTYEYPKQVKGENNEWFKTLNLSVGMQFRMSQQFSLQFEPTLKAPLAGVGEGEVSLVSLGAFINLRYEIPFNKRKRDEE